MIFTKKMRANSTGSLVLTIPADIVEALNIKRDDFVTFDIQKVIKETNNSEVKDEKKTNFNQ